MQRALLRMLKGVPAVSVCVACAVCGAGRAWAA